MSIRLIDLQLLHDAQSKLILIAQESKKLATAVQQNKFVDTKGLIYRNWADNSRFRCTHAFVTIFLLQQLWDSRILKPGRHFQRKREEIVLALFDFKKTGFPDNYHSAGNIFLAAQGAAEKLSKTLREFKGELYTEFNARKKWIVIGTVVSVLMIAYSVWMQTELGNFSFVIFFLSEIILILCIGFYLDWIDTERSFFSRPDQT